MITFVTKNGLLLFLWNQIIDYFAATHYFKFTLTFNKCIVHDGKKKEVT